MKVNYTNFESVGGTIGFSLYTDARKLKSTKYVELNMKRTPQVIDFFCGAGGFSEGFRQQGFEIVMGIDNWSLAIKTHNLNHNLHDKIEDVLRLGSSIDDINNLPDTEMIVGSPPCVLFSHSNKGGNADKKLGIELIEAFLRIIAIKKHKPNSKLVAWFMENVPNSKNHVEDTYTFRQLNLVGWAKRQKIDPDTIALNARKNGHILDTADFGTPQKRKRFLCGEIVSSGSFPELKPFMVKEPTTLGMIMDKMPSPIMGKSEKIYTDPNYPTLKFPAKDISDHFYDSGVYECQWLDALWLKTNHPYMGKMSFPENRKKPSRTVMATQSASTREALIYKSEYKRKGDGEYRLPTIREVATIMGFPYSYQFTGSEGSKWRQVGNAVSPHLSATLAKSIRLSMGLPFIADSKITFDLVSEKMSKVENLNRFTEATFDTPPKKNIKARFRRHSFKDGNMTVALTNFDPRTTAEEIRKRKIDWFCSVFFGAGEGFLTRIIMENEYKSIDKLIEVQHGNEGVKFIEKFNKQFNTSIGHSKKFQDAYVGGNSSGIYEPRHLVDMIGQFILDNEPKEKNTLFPGLHPEKQQFPTKQVLAIYAINRIIS